MSVSVHVSENPRVLVCARMRVIVCVYVWVSIPVSVYAGVCVRARVKVSLWVSHVCTCSLVSGVRLESQRKLHPRVCVWYTIVLCTRLCVRMCVRICENLRERFFVLVCGENVRTQ